MTDMIRNDEVARNLVLAAAEHGKFDSRLTAIFTGILDEAYRSHRTSLSRCKGGVRSTDSATSAEAAMSVNVAELEHMVLRILAGMGRPLTMQAVADISQAEYKSVSPRFAPLEAKGMIRVVGVDRSSGRGRQTYALTDAGVSLIARNPVWIKEEALLGCL